MQRTKLYVATCLLIALAMGAGGCAAKPAGLSDQQVIAVTQNALQALDANDYEAFTADFSDQMGAAFSQAQFDSLRNMLQEASGNFVSAGALSLSNSQGFAVYKISCEYARENVVVKVIFKIGGNQVEGLYLDSSNLRKVSQ